jgi:ribose transport system substrate-binding protein
MKRLQFSSGLVAILVFVGILLFSSTGAFAAPLKVGVVVPTMNVFYQPLSDGVKEAVEEQGGTTIVLDSQLYKVAKELANVEDLLEQHIDVLIIDASDKIGSSPAIEACNKAGVPVVALNNETASGKFITIVATDNYEAGRLAAEYVMTQIGGKGTVAIINGPPVPAVLDRIQAYRDVVKKYPKVKIVADQQMGNTIADGITVAENILTANPNINGFLCMNDGALLGAITALQNAKKIGKVACGAVDAAPFMTNLLATGLAPKCATAAQYPKLLGRKAVEAYLDYKAGKSVPKNVKVKTLLITQENALGFSW